MTPELNAVLSKSPVWRKLYETNAHYRKLWDEGKGPVQQPNELDYGPRYNHWGPLHYYAVKHANDWSQAKAKAFYRNWKRNIPNTKGCGCQAKWKKLGLVPDYTSAKAFFEWACMAHNKVNLELEKPILTMQDCYAIWWPLPCEDS